MAIFKQKDEKLDSLYSAINKNGRINELLNNCYEYGKLTPKQGKSDTCDRLKEIAKQNREDLKNMIDKKKK